MLQCLLSYIKKNEENERRNSKIAHAVRPKYHIYILKKWYKRRHTNFLVCSNKVPLCVMRPDWVYRHLILISVNIWFLKDLPYLTGAKAGGERTWNGAENCIVCYSLLEVEGLWGNSSSRHFTWMKAHLLTSHHYLVVCTQGKLYRPWRNSVVSVFHPLVDSFNCRTPKITIATGKKRKGKEVKKGKQWKTYTWELIR